MEMCVLKINIKRFKTNLYRKGYTGVSKKVKMDSCDFIQNIEVFLNNLRIKSYFSLMKI